MRNHRSHAWSELCQSGRLVLTGRECKFHPSENHEVRATIELPADLVAVTIKPHMHLLSKQMPVTATPADRKLVPLIHIRNGNLNWQESYPFREPVKRRTDARIELVAHFDNYSKKVPRRNVGAPSIGVFVNSQSQFAVIVLVTPTKPLQQFRTA